MNNLNYSEHPCGADGLSFPQGLPDDDETVEALTVWSNGKYERMIFRETYGWGEHKRTYGWFKVYSKPIVEEGSMPIVLDWRKITD